MALFRKKTVNEIEAYQFFPETIGILPENVQRLIRYAHDTNEHILTQRTRRFKVNRGDFIVIYGESINVMTEQEFKRTYERVDDKNKGNNLLLG